MRLSDIVASEPLEALIRGWLPMGDSQNATAGRTVSIRATVSSTVPTQLLYHLWALQISGVLLMGPLSMVRESRAQ